MHMHQVQASMQHYTHSIAFVDIPVHVQWLREPIRSMVMILALTPGNAVVEPGIQMGSHATTYQYGKVRDLKPNR